MKLLAVDTCLGACSAACLCDDSVAARRFAVMARGHAEALAPMVAETLAEAGWNFADLDRLAVTTGPGTFTGQRIGLAFMRALRQALGKPLNGVTSLAAMIAQAQAETGAKTAAAVHDARRGEVYLQISGDAAPTVVTFDAAIARLRSLTGPLALAGTAAAAAAAALDDTATATEILAPDAVWAGRLALAEAPADTAPKPLYLRAPDAKLPAAKQPAGR